MGISAVLTGLSPSLPDLPGFRILLRGILHPGLCYGAPSGLDIIHAIDPKIWGRVFCFVGINLALKGKRPVHAD